MFLLVVHIIGTLYTEHRFDLIRQGFTIIFECFRMIFKGIYSSRSSPIKPMIRRKIPQEYLYNYRLKPSTNLRLEQVGEFKRISMELFSSFSHHRFNLKLDLEF